MLILSPSSCPRTIIKCYKRESKDNVFAGLEISLHQTRINKIVLYIFPLNPRCDPILYIHGSLGLESLQFYLAWEGEEHGVNNIEQKSKQLQKSLPQISTLFYPLGGRCLKDDASIHCNGKGGEYLEVQVNSCLSQFLERVEHLQETELLNQQVHLPFESDETALVTVQLDMFECGGVAIGIGVSHRTLDGFSALASFY